MIVEIMHVLQVSNFWKLTKRPVVTVRKVAVYTKKTCDFSIMHNIFKDLHL